MHGAGVQSAVVNPERVCMGDDQNAIHLFVARHQGGEGMHVQ